MLKLLPASVVLMLSAFSLFAQNAVDAPLLINRVAINQTSVAFTYAGKIWLVDRNGGAARRLTNTPTEETNPVFSPDGKQIAFSRFNGNDADVFVVAADGSGEARRVTMMPEDDFVTAWTPDGREVIFETTRDEEGVTRLYKMAVENGTLAAGLPMPQAFQGAFSPDGKRVAYNPRSIFGEWRYYRGGNTSPIYIADLKTGAVEKLPNRNFNDRNVAWLGDKIYFISDRTGVFNLFAHDLKTKQARQLTNFTGHGVKAAAVTTDAAVYVREGRIHIFDLASGADRIVSVSVSPDMSELAPHQANAMRFLEQIMPSRDGEKIAFGTRGEVLVFDTKTNQAKNRHLGRGRALPGHLARQPDDRLFFRRNRRIRAARALARKRFGQKNKRRGQAVVLLGTDLVARLEKNRLQRPPAQFLDRRHGKGHGHESRHVRLLVAGRLDAEFFARFALSGVCETFEKPRGDRFYIRSVAKKKLSDHRRRDARRDAGF
jgi:tricorn protease